MSDDLPPPIAEPGAPRFAWFDGIVEGRLGDGARVRAAALGGNAAGFGRMSVSVDGGRFSLLLDDAPVGAAQMTDANRQVFIAALSEIAAAADGPLESTLRCTEVFANEVRETVFLPDAGRLRAVTRTRPVTPADLARGPGGAAPAASAMGRGRLAIVLLLLLAAFGTMAWAGGWVDRVFAPGANVLTVAPSPFDRMLEVSVAKSWGSYELTVRRAAGYPVESAALDALRGAAATPAERAAIDAVAGGRVVWARLEAADGSGLAAVAVELGPLVESERGASRADLPVRLGAARVVLCVDRGDDLR